MLVVKRIINDDLDNVIQIHNISFKAFFLTSLGDNFLKLYYRSVAKSSDGVVLGAFSDNKLVGFCAATFKSQGFYFHLIKENLVYFIGRGVRLLCTRPKSLIRLIRNMTKKSVTVLDDGNYAELLSIAVNPDTQNMGVGKELLFELEKLLMDRKIKQISLTTDFYENRKVMDFYLSWGYKIYYEFVSYPHRKMYRLIKNIL